MSVGSGISIASWRAGLNKVDASTDFPGVQGVVQVSYSGATAPDAIWFKVNAPSDYNIAYYWDDTGSGISYNGETGIVFDTSTNYDTIGVFLTKTVQGVMQEIKYVIVLYNEPAYPAADDELSGEPAGSEPGTG